MPFSLLCKINIITWILHHPLTAIRINIVYSMTFIQYILYWIWMQHFNLFIPVPKSETEFWRKHPKSNRFRRVKTSLFSLIFTVLYHSHWIRPRGPLVGWRDVPVRCVPVKMFWDPWSSRWIVPETRCPCIDTSLSFCTYLQVFCVMFNDRDVLIQGHCVTRDD